MLSKEHSRVKGVLLLALMFNTSLSNAQTLLEGGVKKVWTVPAAREEVFKGVQGIIDTWGFPPKDPNLSEHLRAIAQKRSFSSGRKITVFDTKDYAITPECSLETRYYNLSGDLYLVQFNSSTSYSTENCEQVFPSKALRYDYPSGKLIQAAFSPKKADDYLYDADGSFLGHWLGSKCYNEDGSICGYRRSFIERNTSIPK